MGGWYLKNCVETNDRLELKRVGDAFMNNDFNILKFLIYFYTSKMAGIY